MKLKTLTWNIGGGKVLKPGEDPGLMASYSVDGLNDIIHRIRDADPDIITLQEAEGDEDTNQVEYIANRLGYKYSFYDPTSGSHIDTTQSLGNGIVSKYPITEHSTGLFHNPNIRFELEGSVVESHDKGYGQCLISIDGFTIRTTTLHLLPFQRIGIELESDIAKEIYESVTTELTSSEDHILIQGDFNIDSSTVTEYLSSLFSKNELSEINLDVPTTPKDRRYDHVLFKGLHLIDFEVDPSVTTDHYPVICTFEL